MQRYGGRLQLSRRLRGLQRCVRGRQCTPGAETCETCDQDCGTCPDVCGDGACSGDENCANCAADCGACTECGDGTCDPDETCQSCPADCPVCPPECGDFFCNGDETCETCPGDCGECVVCGDNVCTAPDETCSSCEADCGACPPVCGDGTCDANETCESCQPDCGACPAVCGDGTCDNFQGEDCLTCADDCTVCECGDGVCQFPLEGCGLCAADCGDCPPPTNDCCSTSSVPGCVDTSLQNCVCNLDQTCCQIAWDESCIELGNTSCDFGCPVEGTTDCCTAHFGGGCTLEGQSTSGPTTHNITIVNFTFVPDSLTIQAGDTVVWTNQDAFHTTNSESVQEPFDSLLTSGASFSHCSRYPPMPTITIHPICRGNGHGPQANAVRTACVNTTRLLLDALGRRRGLSATVCASSCGCDGGSPAQSCCDQGEGGVQ